MSEKNTLFEAASEILNKSIKNAPKAKQEELDADVEVIGGPTPFNAEPLGDSEKLDPTKGTPDNKKSTESIKAKSSDRVPKFITKEDQNYSEEIKAIFEGEKLSEDFMNKAKTIFEARLLDRVSKIEEELEEKYKNMLEDTIKSITEELEEKIESYIQYVAEQWMKENELAIETGLRAELAEDFINGLKNLFVEHYMEIPEDKVNIVEELSSQVLQMEEKLNEVLDENIKIKKSLVESKKLEIISNISEGLIDTHAEKLKKLAESVEFISEEDYAGKLKMIKENYFSDGSVKKATPDQLNETLEDTEVLINDSDVAEISKILDRL